VDHRECARREPLSSREHFASAQRRRRESEESKREGGLPMRRYLSVLHVGVVPSDVDECKCAARAVNECGYCERRHRHCRRRHVARRRAKNDGF